MMHSASRCRRIRLSAGVLGVLLGLALTSHSEPTTVCLDLDQLQRMGPDELDALFRQSELGKPLVGVANGRLLYLTDKRLPRLKLRVAKAVWRGKEAHADGYFVNRWIGNVNWIDSTYVIGPSWVDGKPAIIMEYAPGTPLFANMHDELREVAPGLYMGPVFERFPCPKFRGYVALQLTPCCEQKPVPCQQGDAPAPAASPAEVKSSEEPAAPPPQAIVEDAARSPYNATRKPGAAK